MRPAAWASAWPIRATVGWSSTAPRSAWRRATPIPSRPAKCRGPRSRWTWSTGGEKRRGSARCVPPAAKLAELLVLQGRFEEAEQLLGDDESAEAQVARAHLALANGDTSLAISAASRAAR